MAKAEHQRHWRARDQKKTIQVRLSAEAVARLETLVARFGARGRGDALEHLLTANAGDHADLLLNEAIRLGRAYPYATGRAEGALCDASGHTYVIRRDE